MQKYVRMIFYKYLPTPNSARGWGGVRKDFVSNIFVGADYKTMSVCRPGQRQIQEQVGNAVEENSIQKMFVTIFCKIFQRQIGPEVGVIIHSNVQIYNKGMWLFQVIRKL